VLGVRGRAAPARGALELGEQRLALGRHPAEPAQVGARALTSIGAPASPSPCATASDGSPSAWADAKAWLPIPTRSLAWNSRPGLRRSAQAADRFRHARGPIGARG
jgi:hypothetical protein